MRKKVLFVIVLLSVLSAQGFVITPQFAGTTLTVLNRAGKPTTQITDGDTVQLQVELAQAASQTENINFLLGDTTVGSCVIPSGQISGEVLL